MSHGTAHLPHAWLCGQFTTHTTRVVNKNEKNFFCPFSSLFHPFVRHSSPQTKLFIFLQKKIQGVTTGRLYDEFICLLFFHAHREASVLTNELSEESDQFRFLKASCFANLKGAVGLIMTKTSTNRISIPLEDTENFILSWIYKI